MAIIGNFLNGTALLEQLLKEDTPSKTWDNYCAMISAERLTWEEKADDLGKAMILLMNSKNEAAKKDLRLAYAQGNHSEYPSTMEKMARFILSQYKNKNINPNNNPREKKWDKNRKKGDEAKSEDKDYNNTGTAGTHVEETSADQDAGATSDGSSIGAHVSDVTKTNVPSTQNVQELLAAHPVDDPIWDHTDSCDILVDTVNSAEAMAGSHIVEDLFQPKTSTISTRALISVHFKTVRYFSQPIFRFFSYLKNA